MRDARTFDGIEYAPGRKFRVIAEGATMSGWAPTRHAGAFDMTRRDLAVGEIVECRGFGPGWGSDPGYGIEFVGGEIRPAVGGIWSYRPQPGLLEPVDDKEVS